jgi:hypothetical protein
VSDVTNKSDHLTRVGESARFVSVREIAEPTGSGTCEAGVRMRVNDLIQKKLVMSFWRIPSWLIPGSDVVEVNRSIKKMKRHCREGRTGQ